MAATGTVALPFFQPSHPGCFPEFQISNTLFQNPDALALQRGKKPVKCDPQLIR